MVEKYKCGNIECEAHGVAVPDLRILRSSDGGGRICSRKGGRVTPAQGGFDIRGAIVYTKRYIRDVV